MSKPGSALSRCGWHRFSLVRFLSRFLVGALLVFPGLTSQIPAKQPPKIDPVALPTNLKNRSVEELIDRLREEPEEQLNVPWRESLGGDGEPFVGKWVSPKSGEAGGWKVDADVSPAIWELVSRGAGSLPGLLAHLEDRRPTKRFVWYTEADERGGFVSHEDFDLPGRPSVFRFAKLVSAFYRKSGVDLTNFEKAKRRFLDEEKEVEGWRYTMKVGDLCYLCIGQIVNRPYHVISARFPERKMEFQSPVHTRGVARACREEWGERSAPEKHKESLINDSLNPRLEVAPFLALNRLYFYYQEAGEARIVNHIKRPFLPEISVSAFVHNELLQFSKENEQKIIEVDSRLEKNRKFSQEIIRNARRWHLIPDLMEELLETLNEFAQISAQDQWINQAWAPPPAKDARQLLAEFERAHGKSLASQIPMELYLQVMKEDAGDLQSRIKQQLAKAMLKELFPEFKPYQYTFVDRATRKECTEFLVNLPRYASDKIDRAVFEVLQRVSHFGPIALGEIDFAHACVRYLAGQPIEAELRAYLKKRIETAQNAPSSDDNSYDEAIFTDLLKRLKK